MGLWREIRWLLAWGWQESRDVLLGALAWALAIAVVFSPLAIAWLVGRHCG